MAAPKRNGAPEEDAAVTSQINDTSSVEGRGAGRKGSKITAEERAAWPKYAVVTAEGYIRKHGVFDDDTAAAYIIRKFAKFDLSAADAAAIAIEAREGLEAEGFELHAPKAATFAFETDLGDIAAGGIPDPPQHSPRLYVNRVHWYSGHPGHGKTTLAAADAVAHMETGAHVVWLDFEAGKRQTVARLLAAGATVDQLREQFHLAVSPPMAADPDGFAPLAAALEEWPGALVVFDSASKALSGAGIEENDPAGNTRWTASVILPAREAGATVVVIDHVQKGATRTTPYPRGAGSKLADTDVAWYVEATERFDREKSGRVELTRHKDREGLLPERLAYTVGDGAGKLPVVQVDAETEETQDRRDGAMRAKVLAVLQEHSTPDTPISTKQVLGRVVGRDSAVTAALRELAEDRSAPVSTVNGPRGSILYAHDPDAVGALAVADHGGLDV